MGKVYLIRHGATMLNGDTNSADRIRGWIDVPLNTQGQHDADKAGEKLKNEHPTAIYSSDLERAVETADIINRRFHVEVHKTSDLRPWGLGSLQGQKTKDIQPEMRKLVENPSIPAPGGESYQKFCHRYLSLLERLMILAEKDNKIFFVVCHFRNLITFDGWKQNGYQPDYSVDSETVLGDKFKTGEIYEIDLQQYFNEATKDLKE